MGDEESPVELNLEFGVVVGEERSVHHDEDGSGGTNFDEYYDVEAADIDDKGGDGGEDRPPDVHKKPIQYDRMPPANTKGPPRSLLQLATGIVAYNLEKYPPGLVGVLSEYHWECVLRARVKLKREHQPDADDDVDSPRRESGDPRSSRERLNDEEERNVENRKKVLGRRKTVIAMEGRGNKRLLPVVCERALVAVEGHPMCTHLSRSRAADELVWKDVVDYEFDGAMNRPGSLEVPCDVLKGRLREWVGELAELLSSPMDEEEFLASRRRPISKAVALTGDYHVGSKRGREEALFGSEESGADDNSSDGRKDETRNSDTFLDGEAYRQYLEIQSDGRTSSLRRILLSLKHTPMDVTLLAETEMGKSASRAAKAMKKLEKQMKGREEGGEDDVGLVGYPRFWERASWEPESYNQQQQMRGNSWGNKGEGENLTTPLELLQQILRDWKRMASDDGVEMSAAASPSKNKQRTGNEKTTNFATADVAVATCGRDKRVSAEQHRIDMDFLHASPDWRSLCRSLRERAALVRKAHGERVRSVRENLQKDRRTVGKVVLKRAVGRVRGGGGVGDGNGVTVKKLKSPFPAMGHNLRGPGAMASASQRKEAILSKSLGHRAKRREQQLISQNARSSSGRLSQIRGEARTAASRSKSTFSVASAKKPSSFGASVALAGTGGGARKLPPPGSQVHVQLKGGKRMALPPTSRVGRGIMAKLQKQHQQGQRQGRMQTKQQHNGGGGVFSFLEQKKKSAEKQPRAAVGSSFPPKGQRTAKMRKLQQQRNGGAAGMIRNNNIGKKGSINRKR